MAPDPDPSTEATDAEPGLGGLDEAQEAAPESTRRFGLRRPEGEGPEPVAEGPAAVDDAVAAAAVTPAPIGVRLVDLEERLDRLEDDVGGPGLDDGAAPASADAAAVEELRRAVAELEARVDANVARLQKVEAADAARLRRFDSEVRKISGAATAGLRQALEEAEAAGTDAARLGRIEVQINELRSELNELRSDRESDQELLDLNDATFEELRDLGISGTQATRVIAAREAAGGFGSLDELDDLSGFPPAQLEALKAAVRL